MLYIYVNRTSSVIEGFTPSPFAIVHSDSILSLAVIRSQSVCIYFLLKMMATSSAYATTLPPPPSRIRSSLFTAIFHRRGDSTPPCGVPLFTSLVWVEVPTVAATILLISNLWINLTNGGSTPSFVRDSVCSYPKVLNMTTPNKSSRNQVGNSNRRSLALTADEKCLSAYYMSH